MPRRLVALLVLLGLAGCSQPTAVASSAGVATAAVKQGTLSGQITQNGKLSYAAKTDGSDYSIVNQAAGIYTKLPAVGQVVGCGKVLYWIDDDPVLLLCGNRPFYRNLYEGSEGWDVKLLNKNLGVEGNEFTDDTTDALDDLVDSTTLQLGDAVVLPGPVRAATVTALLGGRATPGTPLGSAVTTRREVEVQLNASQQAQVKVGNKAQVTLPDNRVVSGRVSRVGAVAVEDEDGTTTIPVYLTLDKPEAAGKLDAATVRVQITTAGVKNALIVPVTALIGADGGGFAVERVGADGARTTVPVKLGLFDDSAGTVQVSGELKAGDRVVVPST